MKLSVSVTKTEISVGKVQTYGWCPVALAVDRVYALRGVQEKAIVGVRGSDDGTEAFLLYRDVMVALPSEVGRWVDLYDCGCAMYPISFDVDLPDALPAGDV